MVVNDYNMHNCHAVSSCDNHQSDFELDTTAKRINGERYCGFRYVDNRTTVSAFSASDSNDRSRRSEIGFFPHGYAVSTIPDTK